MYLSFTRRQIKRDPGTGGGYGSSVSPATVGVVGRPVIGNAALLQQLQRAEDSVRVLTEENGRLKATQESLELVIAQKVPGDI